MWCTLAALIAAASFSAGPYWSVALSLPFLYVALLSHRARKSNSPSLFVFLEEAVPLLLWWLLRTAFRRERATDEASVAKCKSVITTETAEAYVSLVAGAKTESTTEKGLLNDVPYPPCLLETLMNLPALELLMKCRDLGVSPASLIHVGQKCRVFDPGARGNSWAASLLDRPLSAEVRVGSIEAVPKGTLVTILFDAFRDDEIVWHGETRLLSPDAEAIRKLKEARKKRPQDRIAADENVKEPGTVTKPWSLPSSTLGYSYGLASHDFNLVHLPLACRLAGFRRPILQGMMSLARAVAEMGTAFPDVCRRHPLEVECEWKVPLYLPGEASLELYPSGTFRVLDGRGRPHCVGRFGQFLAKQAG